MTNISYTKRKLLVEQGRVIRKAEAALRSLKRECEKLKQLQKEIDAEK